MLVSLSVHATTLRIDEPVLVTAAQHGRAFGLGAEPAVRIARIAPLDRLGREHVRVQQTSRGIPVSGAELAVHLQGDHGDGVPGRAG